MTGTKSKQLSRDQSHADATRAGQEAIPRVAVQTDCNVRLSVHSQGRQNGFK